MALERSRGHKELVNFSQVQIEHILPQTLNFEWRSDLGNSADQIHAEWVHSPGNLTLSGYNAELWNHPFGTKRERYAQSNIVITRELSNLDVWDEAKIRSRGKLLSKEAAAIWVGPSNDVINDALKIALNLDSKTRRTLGALKALRKRREKKLDTLSGEDRMKAETEIASYDERIAEIMSKIPGQPPVESIPSPLP